jgi:hypothetical protein
MKLSIGILTALKREALKKQSKDEKEEREENATKKVLKTHPFELRLGQGD